MKFVPWIIMAAALLFAGWSYNHSLQANQSVGLSKGQAECAKEKTDKKTQEQKQELKDNVKKTRTVTRLAVDSDFARRLHERYCPRCNQ